MRIANVRALAATVLVAATPAFGQVQAPLVLHGSATGDQFGIAVASVGDFNGDGYDDLAIGANANADAGTAAGRVTVLFGGPSADTLADWKIAGDAGELLGSALSGAGDINGDGFPDLCVGAPSNDQNGSSAGRALLFFGGVAPDTLPDWSTLGQAAVDEYGSALAGGRDLNGDGRTDFVVGAYRFDPPAQSNTGKTYLFAGAASPSAAPLAAPVGFQDGERFGAALATAEDYTGDGVADYLVGAYSYDSGGGGINAGRVLLMQGGPLPPLLPAGSLKGLTPGELFGSAIADVGDVNGDGQADFMVGAYGYALGPTLDAGAARLYFGGTALDSTADFTVTGSPGLSARLGFALAGGVDLNKDGRSDFAIGAPGNSAGSGTGKVLLYRGSATPQPDTTLSAGGTGGEFGYSIALIRNFFGNHSALAVGAWGEDNSRGAVYIYRYAASTPACPITLTGDVDTSGTITAADIIYMVNYVFKAGEAPRPCVASADVDCSGAVTSADIIRLVNYVFKGGLAPCNACTSPLASGC